MFRIVKEQKQMIQDVELVIIINSYRPLCQTVVFSC